MITANYISSFTEKGIRENNEDAVFPEQSTADSKYFIVCDGMGGHGHGEEASRTVADSIGIFMNEHGRLSGQTDKSSFQAALDYAVERLNEKDVYGDSERKMGTTVVLATFTESSVLVGHAGDSRLYHIRGGGILFRTKDHSRVQEWIDAEIITEEEARAHPKKNLITRCIQPHPVKPVAMEIDELTDLRTGDYLFLCTDGVTDAMTDEEIADIISSDIPDDEKTNRIKETCAAGSKDNYSGFLLKIKIDIITEIVTETTDVPTEGKSAEKTKIRYFYCSICGKRLSGKTCADCETSTAIINNTLPPERKTLKKSLMKKTKHLLVTILEKYFSDTE